MQEHNVITGRHDPLHFDANFEFEMEPPQKQEEYACGGMHKVKSGKFAKSNVNIVRQEQWPHMAVSKKYIKCTSFDTMEYEAFIAGESRIIYTMLNQGDSNGVGRLRVLTLITHWYGRTKNWPMVRSLCETIMEEVEMGDHE